MTDTKTMSDEELGTELWHLFASLGRRNPPTVADVLAKARSLLCASPAQPAPPQEPVCAACDAAVPREGPNALAVGEFRVCREHLENFEVRPASATFALYAYCVGRSGRPIPKREPFKHGGTVLMAPPQEPPASATSALDALLKDYPKWYRNSSACAWIREACAADTRALREQREWLANVNKALMESQERLARDLVSVQKANEANAGDARRAERELAECRAIDVRLTEQLGIVDEENKRLRAQLEAARAAIQRGADCEEKRATPEAGLPKVGETVCDIETGDDSGVVERHTPRGRFHVRFSDGDLGVYRLIGEGFTWRRIPQPETKG